MSNAIDLAIITVSSTAYGVSPDVSSGFAKTGFTFSSLDDHRPTILFSFDGTANHGRLDRQNPDVGFITSDQDVYFKLETAGQPTQVKVMGSGVV